MTELWQLLTLHTGYNTQVVMLGATVLGIGAGVIGVFILLNRRAMISDSTSHATLPGIGLGFLVAWSWDIQYQLPFLLIGAASTALLSVLAVQWIKDHTRLPEDTAIGTVLSVSFALGVVLLSYIQTLEGASQAGLNSFLLGAPAALNRHETELILVVASLVIVGSLLVARPLGGLCFDPQYIASLGWSVRRFELVMLILLLILLCIGLKTVGLVLMVALLVIPPVVARLWTDHLKMMLLLSALVGGLAGYGGAASSALYGLPAGSMMILSAGVLLLVSLVCTPKRR